MEISSNKFKRSSSSVAAIKEEKSTSTTTTTNVDQEDMINQVAGTGKQFITNEDNIISSKPPSPTNNQKESISSFNKQVTNATDSRRSSVDRKSNSTSSDQKDQDDKLESAKAEMSEVRVENERLKTTLSRVVKDYQSLQMHFFDIVQQDQTKKPISMDITPPPPPPPPPPAHQQEIEIEEEPEFISLSLGRSPSIDKTKKDEKISMMNNNSIKLSKEENDQVMKEGLSLGLDCKFEVSNLSGPTELASNPSPENSFEEPKEEEAGEQWPPGKMLKTVRSGDDEVSQQAQVKKARVSVRARCDTPTMNDGCQWRKYGQKIAKGNPCPRAYYRCTVAPACPVRKQVQRCAENMSILITTYEGTHNHPLPISATAMASTTSAAASMLLSGSTSSRPNLGQSATTTTGSDLHGLNFSLSDNSRSRQFYLPNSSISSSPSYPTITLDLTAPPSSASSSAGSQFSRLSSNFPTTRYSPTSFNFSSASESNTLPTSWGNGYLNYGTHQSYNKNQIGTLNLGRQPQQEQFYQPYLQKNNPVDPPQQSMTDTIAAATKAITSDPSFRSALAAAITSIVGGSAGANGSQGVAENFGQNLKWD